MKVNNLIKRLKRLNGNKNIVFSSDEELNRLFENVYIANTDENGYVIYPDEQAENHI